MVAEEGIDTVKIAIVHQTLRELGGGERICISLTNALNKAGLTPDVYTNNPVEKTRLENFYGKKLKLNLHSLSPIVLPILGIYQRILASFMSFTLTNYDVVINTTGVYTPLSFATLMKRYILYVHMVPVEPFKLESNLKYQRNLFWKMYFQPYQSIVKNSAKRIVGEVLANSNFTRRRIEKYWHKKATTVYPPVDIESFSSTFYNRKRDGVITIGRFSPEKNHFIQLELAKRLPNITFRICGSVNTPFYENWFRKIKAKVEEEELKNVELHSNVPFKQLVRLIGESKIFFHVMFNEDFGLTTCEAIAGGCVPCVHNSGGQIEVVPDRDHRFSSIGEAAGVIEKINSMGEGEIEGRRERFFRHVKNFDEQKFQSSMLEVIGV